MNNKINKYYIIVLILHLFLSETNINAQLPSYLPTNGLVAWYPFNGNANDESGNGNNATNYGGVLTSDRNNNPQAAYSFASGYVSINSGSFGSASFTFSAWAKPNSITGNGFGDIGGTYFNYQGYFVGIQNGIPKARIHSSVNNSIQEVASAQAVLPNEWYHITVTYETPILKIYVNGINTGTVNTGTFQFTNRNSFAIGRSPWVLNESQSSFPGSIDDVAIYNRALTPTEINSVYTNTTGNTGGGTTTTSPAPPGIPYQAEVRNESGEVLANANVNIRFTLHELTSTGTVSYQETHALTTNELGLFAATIGAGTATQGTFAGINWAQTTKFLQVEVDTGSGWITMGNQQLMSVPYALYAANGPQGESGPQGPAGVDGEPGPQGEPGANGLSAYEVWLAQGNTGGTDAFFNSIVTSFLPENTSNGSILIWNNDSIKSLPIGTDNQVLQIINGVPTWTSEFNNPSPKLRDIYQGGYVFYIFQPGDIDYIEGETHGLIAAPINQAGIPWSSGNCNSTIIGASNSQIGSGAINTSIISNCSNDVNTAAGWTSQLDYAGYSDWYLPNSEELRIAHQNLNDWGITIFDGSSTKLYWASNENNANYAIARDFGVPSWAGFSSVEKNRTIYMLVKPIRKF